MPALPDWLPDLVPFSDYGGDWRAYLDALYVFFSRDFIDSKPSFRGVRLGLKRHPIIDGKEATFWHMISEGSEESERLPDMRRCERIRWPRPIIENADDRVVKIWRESRKGDVRIHLWFESAEYLVVLNERNGYLLPWTAYPVTRTHEHQKLNRRWEQYRENN